MPAFLAKPLLLLAIAAALFAAGVGAGAYFHAEFRSGPAIASLRVELRDAQRQVLLEHAARTALQDRVDRGDAALGDAADSADTVRRAQDRAIREINDATADDASGLDALLRRMRQQSPTAAGAGGDSRDAAGDARP